ncbi:MAG: enoyl-CoA hydratase family protein [Myxococcota bacterium]
MESSNLRPMVDGLTFEAKDGIGRITLTREDTLGSLTFDIYQRLVDLFRELETLDEVKAVIITGQGRGFCSGGDVHDIIGRLMDYGPADMTAFARMTGDVIRNMRRLRKPIIAAINGTTAGAGAVIALAADLRIASRNSKIAFLFTKVGLTGADMGAAYLLPRVIGLAKASELLMLGDSVSAEEAERIGLFNRVVDPDALLTEANALAERLARGPSFSLGMTKELLNNGLSMDLNSALDAEARAQTICMLADDFKEFHAAFVDKRKPSFRGT